MARLATALVLVAATLWGCNGLFVSYLTQAGLQSAQFTAVRFMSAALAAVCVCLVRDRGSLRVGGRSLAWLVLNGAVGAFAFGLTYTLAIQMTGMATAAVLIYLMPSLVMAWSVLRGTERLTGRKVVCLALSLLGCALVSGLASGDLTVSLAGVGMGLLAALFYSLNNIVQGGPLRSLDALVVAALTLVFAALAACAYALATTGMGQAFEVFAQRPDALLVNVLYGVVCSVATFFSYNLALRFIPASRAAVFATFEPVAAAILGAAVLGDAITIGMVAGIACEVGALVLMQTSPQEG